MELFGVTGVPFAKYDFFKKPVCKIYSLVIKNIQLLPEQKNQLIITCTRLASLASKSSLDIYFIGSVDMTGRS